MRPLLVLTGLAALLATAGCGESGHPLGGPARVVAAENVWGDLARQVGGARARVTSVVDSPNADPHDYEPTAADARHLADAQLVVLNGIGYDPWADRLLAANPVPGRIVMRIGDLAGLHGGDNPHQWYSPSVVRRFLDDVTARLAEVDPKDAAYFRARRRALERGPLLPYRRA